MGSGQGGAKPLWGHQREALERSESLDSFGLFFEMGAGKTRTFIEILKRKNQKHGRNLKTLVLTPSVVTYNWKREFSMFSPEIQSNHVLVLSGSGLERQRVLERTPTYFVVICNYETLGMEPVFSALKAWGPEVIVCDESHRIKNPRAERTKRAIALSTLAKYRYILSGTPILQNSMDLWSQYMFLDNGQTLGKNFFFFKNAYFRDANKELRARSPHVTWPKWVPQKMKEQELTAKIMSKAMSVKKSDCLDLPPLIRQTFEVDMTKEQWKAYKDMKEDYIAFVNSKAYTAQLAITKALRLQQIVSGFLMSGNEGDKPHIFENTPREKALLDLLEDILEGEKSKVLIWACWRANHDIIRKLLTKHRIEFRAVLGDTNQSDRDRFIQDFRERDEVRVFLGSQAALGIGINLVEADHAIYYSRNFSLEHDLQSESRNYRGGSNIHSKVTRIDLLTKGTIDEAVVKALEAKQEISDTLIHMRRIDL